MKASDLVTPTEGDILQTLRDCDGYYDCPKDEHAKRLGPLVGYAGTYDADGQRRQYVGDVYLNFAMAEEYPLVLASFADELAKKLQVAGIETDYAVAAPMGGVSLGVALATKLDCRYVFPEKSITALATGDLREQSEMKFKRHQLESGTKAIIVEDVCHNFSTTKDMVDLIEAQGATVVAIACALNRSAQEEFEYTEGRNLPVISLLHVDIARWRQNDAEVSADIEAGNVILKPKDGWSRLKVAMDKK